VGGVQRIGDLMLKSSIDSISIGFPAILLGDRVFPSRSSIAIKVRPDAFSDS